MLGKRIAASIPDIDSSCTVHGRPIFPSSVDSSLYYATAPSTSAASLIPVYVASEMEACVWWQRQCEATFRAPDEANLVASLQADRTGVVRIHLLPICLRVAYYSGRCRRPLVRGTTLALVCCSCLEKGDCYITPHRDPGRVSDLLPTGDALCSCAQRLVYYVWYPHYIPMNPAKICALHFAILNLVTFRPWQEDTTMYTCIM